MNILLIVYDNDSYIHTFPQGIAYLSATLNRAGHYVKIYNQDQHHWPAEHLTEYLDIFKFDVVGLGFIGGYYQYKKALEIAAAVNASYRRDNFKFILGGHGPSPDPDYFINVLNADAVIVSEGEQAIVDYINDMGKRVVQAEQIKDIDAIPMPAYDLFDINYYRLLRQPHAENSDFVMPVLSGRGCPFNCNFCYRMDKGYRPRGTHGIISEIQYLNRYYGINYIEFTDELLMSSVERTHAICDAIQNAKLKIKWSCNGRLNYAEIDVLKHMRAAGCVFINYGIESFNDDVLITMKKHLTTKQIAAGIENTLAAGISPGFNIIFGQPGETAEHLNNSVEFLLKYDDGAQLRTIRPVTPYPGSALYYCAIENGFISGTADFYENRHKNSDLLSVNMTGMPDDEFYKYLKDANRRLIDNYNNRLINRAHEQLDDLYDNKNAAFRGFRRT